MLCYGGTKHTYKTKHYGCLFMSMSHRSGRNPLVVDIFGAWCPLLHTAVQDLKGCKLPEPLVHLSKVLECNFEWTEKGEMPFEVLDQLRLKHEIDTTGFNMSRTHRGNLYRSYVLYHGKSAAPPKG